MFLGDGCLMEGISHEACSLAGTLGLGKLICFWDDNGISIDGHVEGWFNDDTPNPLRPMAGVIAGVDGHDPAAIAKGARVCQGDDRQADDDLLQDHDRFRFAEQRPGSHACHGAPLGEEEINLTKAALGWDHGAVRSAGRRLPGLGREREGAAAEAGVERAVRRLRPRPELAAEFTRRMGGELPADWSAKADAFVASATKRPSRRPRARRRWNRSRLMPPRCRNCSAVRPTWLLEPDRVVGLQADARQHAGRQLRQLRCASSACRRS